MAPKAPWHIFFKCFRNQATTEEVAEIKDWLGEDIENLEMLNEVYNVFAISTVVPQPLNPDVQKAWYKIDQKISMTSSVKKINYKFIYAVTAAVLVLGLLLFGVVDNYLRIDRLSHQFTEVTTLPGQKASITLPDGSKVWLNSSSSLKYANNFNVRKREVILSGEAFFKVFKDKSRKFRVKSGILDVEVYGTSFNIKNYPDDQFQEVSVADGIVGVSSNIQEIRKLKKGEQAVLNKESKKILFKTEDADLVTAWKNNELIFRNKPVDEVCKSLESWFGVNIKFDKRMIGVHNYTFKIKTESFKEVLEMMQVMTPFKYTINGKDIEITYNN
jgi:ferric-dicitrate binding protein FerR (iron transport regulator)